MLALVGYLGFTRFWSSPSAEGGSGRCGTAAQLPAVNGAVVAPCAASSPTIDRNFDDWANVPSFPVRNVVATGDSHNATPPTGTWRVTWDQAALYIQATVRDDVLTGVDQLAPSAYWKGDGVSFEFGPDARALSAGDGLRSGQDMHVMIGLRSTGAVASINPALAGGSGGIQFVAGNAEPQITAAAGRTTNGYAVEASIPWSVLRVSAPTPGSVFGFNANISDAAPSGGALGFMVSSNPDRSGGNQPHPGTWRSLVLAG